jgi:hypothetical protein
MYDADEQSMSRSISLLYSLECEILIHLLGAQLEMQLWNFLPSLMLLHLAYTRLTAWESRLQNREVCELGSDRSLTWITNDCKKHMGF